MVQDSSSEKRIRTTIYLSRDLHSEIRIEAIKRNISMTDFIVQAIKHELDQTSKEKPSTKENLKNAA